MIEFDERKKIAEMHRFTAHNNPSAIFVYNWENPDTKIGRVRIVMDGCLVHISGEYGIATMKFEDPPSFDLISKATSDYLVSKVSAYSREVSVISYRDMMESFENWKLMLDQDCIFYDDSEMSEFIDRISEISDMDQLKFTIDHHEWWLQKIDKDVSIDWMYSAGEQTNPDLMIYFNALKQLGEDLEEKCK